MAKANRQTSTAPSSLHVTTQTQKNTKPSGQISTGFSEEVLQKHYDTLKDLELIKVRGDVKVGGAKPDVWFELKVVWEVLKADLSLSPIYTAQGLVCIPTLIP